MFAVSYSLFDTWLITHELGKVFLKGYTFGAWGDSVPINLVVLSY